VVLYCEQHEVTLVTGVSKPALWPATQFKGTQLGDTTLFMGAISEAQSAWLSVDFGDGSHANASVDISNPNSSILLIIHFQV
jgi:hypothetical protein